MEMFFIFVTFLMEGILLILWMGHKTFNFNVRNTYEPDLLLTKTVKRTCMLLNSVRFSI